MKTLIINGSPRINGDTASLLDVIKEKIEGEYRVVDAYRCSISPCLDCRFCWKNNGCAINDEMQEIYDYIQICDNILIASPIYFSELTGKLLDVGSRLQTYFCARFFRKEKPISFAYSFAKSMSFPLILLPRNVSLTNKVDIQGNTSGSG